MDYPDELSLWPHQAQAVDTISAYFDRNVAKRRGSAPAALVNVPTGGGKTAIIATLGHWHPALKRVLVLAPRTAIRTQLAAELAARRGHLQRQGYATDNLPRQVFHLRSSSDLPDELPEGIFVATIQLLDDMRSFPGQALFERIGKACDAIFVDEGHYEPAASWSQTIRNLGRPTVLVTATPYRNDLKAFNIDKGAIHVSRYKELADQRFLRRVKVADIDPDAAGDPVTFVDSVLNTFVAEYGAAPSGATKLIIRCRSEQDIRQIGEQIRQHPLGAGGVLCLHENFTPDQIRPWEKRQPIDPEADDAPAIWVHQHKLLEGVDGPSFRAVAFYGILGSDRALVQQIGRVVRNPKRARNEWALLIDHTAGFIRKGWENYLAYDAMLTPGGVLQGINEIVTILEQGAPGVYYVERKFRRRLRMDSDAERDLRRSLRLPLRCHIVRAGGLDMAALKRLLERRFRDESWPWRVVSQRDDELLVLYVMIAASPLLHDHYFMQSALQVVVARRRGDHLVYLDTGRPNLGAEAASLVAGPIPREALARALSQSRELRVVAVNSQNAALGPSSVRGRSLTAATLEETPPLLDEFQFVASTVKMAGRPAFQQRAPDEDPRPDQFSVREIGFGRGRVSDGGARRRLSGWIAWTDALLAAISDPTQPSPSYLERYATPLSAPPADPTPVSLLIDVSGLAETYAVAPNNLGATVGDPLQIEDALLVCGPPPAAANPNDRSFTMVANGAQVSGLVRFDPTSECYALESAPLARLYRRIDAPSMSDLIDDLNQRQGFVVLPQTAGVIFAGGAFYDPKLRLGAAFNPRSLALDHLFEVHAALRGCQSEKGQGQDPHGWAQGSVFQWIDTNIDQILPGAELVLCDDGTRECCDFLVSGQRNGRDVVALVHAKAAGGSWVAASALYDVCGQAVKQVGALSLFSAQRPHQVHLWDGPWTDPAAKAGDVASRIRHASGAFAGLNGEQIWSQIGERLSRQDTEREVVLVLGASLSPPHLFQEAALDPTPPSAVHAVHLLRSTLAGVVGAGARLRVICG
jgi:hypothetical protein